MVVKRRLKEIQTAKITNYGPSVLAYCKLFFLQKIVLTKTLFTDNVEPFIIFLYKFSNLYKKIVNRDSTFAERISSNLRLR